MKKILRDLSVSGDASFIVKEEIATQFAGPFHYHHGYEFAYIVKGYGKFYGGDQVQNFQSGDIFLFGIGFPHFFMNDQNFIDSGELAHSIVIQFRADFLGNDFYLKPEFKSVKELLKKSYSGLQLINQTSKIKKQIQDLTKIKGLKALIHILQLLEYVASLSKNNIATISSAAYKNPVNTKPNEERLEVVYTYVLEKFKEEVSTKEAAALVFMNEAAFCRYFKRKAHKTFSQFTNGVRITHATYLLTEKEMSVSNICFECGFDNLSYFNRQFKIIVGKTPLAFRNANNHILEK